MICAKCNKDFELLTHIWFRWLIVPTDSPSVSFRHCRQDSFVCKECFDAINSDYQKAPEQYTEVEVEQIREALERK